MSPLTQRMQDARAFRAVWERRLRRQRDARGSHEYWWQRGQIALAFCEQRNSVDRNGWAPGPWDGEPDWQRWEHAGLPCVVIRNSHGAWCGYISVPKGHPWRGMEWENVPADTHGGVTFAQQLGADYWIGFDCNHYLDQSPGMDALLRTLSSAPLLERTYRDLPFVRQTVEAMAEQAAELLACNSNGNNRAPAAWCAPGVG